MGPSFQKYQDPDRLITAGQATFSLISLTYSNAVVKRRASGESAQVPRESNYSEQSTLVRRCIWLRPAPSLPSTASAFQLPSTSRNRSRRLLRRSVEKTACGLRILGFRLSLRSIEPQRSEERRVGKECRSRWS